MTTILTYGGPRLGSFPDDHDGHPTAVLQLDSVVKEYPGDPPVYALRGVDLQIRSGELVAIVGPSGSGKSTLLHIMGTLDRPSRGTARVAGHDVAALSDRQLSALRARRIGFVFQQFFLLDGNSALDNVADGLLYTGAALGKRRRLAAEALARVGLSTRLRHHPAKLSGGERQRVAIARALVTEPRVLLLDEPTSALDPEIKAAVEGTLRELRRRLGISLVLVTHDLDQARRMSEWLLRIENGRAVAAGPTSELLAGVA